jgi:hypothetical protein
MIEIFQEQRTGKVENNIDKKRIILNIAQDSPGA